MMRMLVTAIAALATVLVCTPAKAQAAPATVEEAYAPYAPLIGAWESNGGAIVQRFSWGPGHGYILFSAALRGADGAEHLHFEGIMLYNAESQALDFLVALEPGSLGQEHGVVRAAPDGSIVRDVELIGANGARGLFRQTYRLTGADTGETSMMRDDGQGGWTPTFPGSERLTMRRVG